MVGIKESGNLDRRIRGIGGNIISGQRIDQSWTLLPENTIGPARRRLASKKRRRRGRRVIVDVGIRVLPPGSGNQRRSLLAGGGGGRSREKGREHRSGGRLRGLDAQGFHCSICSAFCLLWWTMVTMGMTMTKYED